ncbi:MAG TPA: thioredoxin family protein [Gemmatimonadaceae bacterium]|nr:thioredoxin family protein [Gemmatimonadaceae bacterium]
MKTFETVRAGAAGLCLAIAGGSLAGCAGKSAPATTATAVPAPARAPLVGRVTRAAIEGYESWKTLRAQDYTPDSAAVRTIAEHGQDVRTLLIFGTWCSSSRREVPRFFKIMDQAGIGLETVTMIGVDQSKKDAEGLTVKHEIRRVPTFVFFRGDREIGRVTEWAASLERDIAAILTK